jgi:hypothetical protein
MAKKNDSSAAQDGVKSQLRDAKGVNAARDAKRGKGMAVLSAPKGAGSAKFRKSRRVPE